MVKERLRFERLYREFCSGRIVNINGWHEVSRRKAVSVNANGSRVESGAVRYAPDRGWGLKIELDQ
jgi:hypothetical protein